MITQRNVRKVMALVMLFGLTAALAVVWDATHASAHNKRTTSMSNPQLSILPSSPNTTISDAIVLEWNEIAVATIGAQPPFPSTRFMATVQVAVFEAVNAITGEYEPYLGMISAPSGASSSFGESANSFKSANSFRGLPSLYRVYR